MFLRVLKGILSRSANTAQTAEQSQEAAELLDRAMSLLRSGNTQRAIVAFRAVLAKEPNNLAALNDLACCLADVGKSVEAAQLYARAFSLDDTFVPAIINHAKLLIDQRQIDDARPFVEQAKLAAPHFANVDAVYAGMNFNLGNASIARQANLRAWLTSFDSLRLANNYLFYGVYDGEVGEAKSASEHVFWADTLRPLEEPPKLAAANSSSHQVHSLSRRIRIGYWSPDLRNHSVRYFFRPLLHQHDRSRFDIFVYHDHPGKDYQTELIRKESTHFFDVSELPDADLAALFKSHELDILVELAGHSSNNRLNTLQARLAPIQITGLGYPPTTGLKNIDAKILDRHLLTKDAAKFYAEEPLVLPSSFWCFDPIEDIPEPAPPPMVFNGYVTFGCPGNIAKITAPILSCWKAILERVPNSRLLIRSINFADSAAIRAMEQRLNQVGIDISRVTLLKPAAPKDFFRSYDQIDIVLDTLPFNGGTTTAFALYMGVPVISWAGRSLTGRMGLSMLNNMGLPDLIVHSAESYVTRAVDLAGDLSYLARLRTEARTRFKRSGLGDSTQFTSEFEQACEMLLRRRQSQVDDRHYVHQVAPLPEDEIMRRAYTVMRTGQDAAAQRIVDHCLRHYPQSGSAHILYTQRLTSEGRFQDAIDYLTQRVATFSPSQQVATGINLVRFHLCLSQRDRARGALAQINSFDVIDDFDRMQIRLLGCAIDERTGIYRTTPASQMEIQPHVRFLVPDNDLTHYESLKQHLETVCGIDRMPRVSIMRCDEQDRLTIYRRTFNQTDIDVIVLLQKSVRPESPAFVQRLLAALSRCDLVSFGGARTWSRLDWRLSNFLNKCAGQLTMSSEKSDFIELQVQGFGNNAFEEGMGILDGRMLGVRRKACAEINFNDELLGAETLLEDAWSHACAKAGLRLGVDRALGVSLDRQIEPDLINISGARWAAAEMMGFDAFSTFPDDPICLSAPLPDMNSALNAMAIYFQETQ